ncbi:MAG TPA: Type 1 glutamine amidotransferase-like domain-containing protein [Candidatus Faecivivens stercorigallinarum]|nr:Type 1 glutamine amidotransferase-like domain-containing protein [Candidatus Faecivivens stercorigallinarum]
MAICFLTSAFNNGFTPVFERVFKRYLLTGNQDAGNFVFIASDFDDPHGNLRWAEEIRGKFGEIGVLFSGFQIVDHTVSPTQAEKYIRDAQVVWLSGGDTLRQIASFQEYHLRELLMGFDGIVIGMSAGSINMADRVVLARNIYDRSPQLEIYQGLGLVEINIEPHLDPVNAEHLDDILEASVHAPIYGLFDDSFILDDGQKVTIYGPYCLYNLQNGETSIR